MHQVFAILLLFASSAVAASEKTELRKIWVSPLYVHSVVPKAWQPAKAPPTESDVNAFERFPLKAEGLSIPNFIARFGLPSRYLTTKEDDRHDCLIYDLPSGHAVALYAPKPPADTFSGCVVITSDGSLVALIK